MSTSASLVATTHQQLNAPLQLDDHDQLQELTDIPGLMGGATATVEVTGATGPESNALTAILQKITEGGEGGGGGLGSLLSLFTGAGAAAPGGPVTNEGDSSSSSSDDEDGVKKQGSTQTQAATIPAPPPLPAASGHRNKKKKKKNNKEKKDKLTEQQVAQVVVEKQQETKRFNAQMAFVEKRQVMQLMRRDPAAAKELEQKFLKERTGHDEFKYEGYMDESLRPNNPQDVSREDWVRGWRGLSDGQRKEIMALRRRDTRAAAIKEEEFIRARLTQWKQQGEEDEDDDDDDDEDDEGGDTLTDLRQGMGDVNPSTLQAETQDLLNVMRQKMGKMSGQQRGRANQLLHNMLGPQSSQLVSRLMGKKQSKQGKLEAAMFSDSPAPSKVVKTAPTTVSATPAVIDDEEARRKAAKKLAKNQLKRQKQRARKLAAKASSSAKTTTNA